MNLNHSTPGCMHVYSLIHTNIKNLFSIGNVRTHQFYISYHMKKQNEFFFLFLSIKQMVIAFYITSVFPAFINASVFIHYAAKNMMYSDKTETGLTQEFSQQYSFSSYFYGQIDYCETVQTCIYLCVLKIFVERQRCMFFIKSHFFLFLNAFCTYRFFLNIIQKSLC